MSVSQKKPMQLPDRQLLAQYDTALANLDQRREALQLEARELDRKFQGSHNVHNEAWSLARRLLHSAPTDRDAFLRHFLHYVEELGLDKQGDLYEVPIDAKVAHLRQRQVAKG